MTDLKEQLAHHQREMVANIENREKEMRIYDFEAGDNALARAAKHAAICTELRAMIAEEEAND